MWIDALRIEGGVLDGFEQRFSDKLNVLIGGRGTGKSSVIELIRFCLGASSYTEAGKSEAYEHALGVLGDGRVTVTLTNGRETFEVSRTAQDTASSIPDNFTPPFVFSQSEIESVGLEAQSRLRLIDDFLGIEGAETTSISKLSSKIRSTTAEIRNLFEEIDDIAEKTEALPKLQKQLNALRQQGAAQSSVHKEIESHRGALDELTPQLAAARVRAELIERAAERLSDWNFRFENLLDQIPMLEPWPPQAEMPDQLTDLRKREEQAAAQLKAALKELKSIATELDRRKVAAASKKTGFENRARDIRQKIEEKQKGASALDKQISDVTQQISVLESLVGLREQRETRVSQLKQERMIAIELLEAERQKRTNQRERIALHLNEKLGPTIHVSVKPSSQLRHYLSLLLGALRGSGLRYTELSERISETYSPEEIATLAESRDFVSVANTLKITEERAIRLCNALRGSDSVNLFTVEVEDDVELKLMDGTDYKDIDFLSMGQRCTVILPVILLHDERIIILDQPEDHLDNAFVVGSLVKSLKARSQTAQSIVATHNPNIPVLGDSERVIHLDSDGTRCFVRVAGYVTEPGIVDAITTIMEGGRQAFERRAQFYAENIPNGVKA